MEVNGFNRYEISGANALDWLDSLSCSRVPRAEGRLALTYFLTDKGNIMAEATLANVGVNTVWYGSRRQPRNTTGTGSRDSCHRPV